MFRFLVKPQDGEQVTQNNTRDAMVEVVDRRERVLYMEGEPRPEAKFVRRAVADDPELRRPVPDIAKLARAPRITDRYDVTTPPLDERPWRGIPA